MYGITKSLLLKRDIMYILDDQKSFITTTELQKQLGYSSQSTIKKTCRELQQEILEMYPDKEIDLQIHKREGVKLDQIDSKLQEFWRNFFFQDISYQIYYAVLFHKQYDFDKFCIEHHISESTLKRKVRTINTFLTKYELHISVASGIKINGAEHRIRNFSLIFLFLAHRQFNNIPWIKEKNKYSMRAGQINHYLKLGLDENQLNVLSIYFFINHYAVENDLELSFSEGILEIFDNIIYPIKPSFLKEWSTVDWQFFLVSLYALDFFNFSIALDFQNIYSIYPPNPANHWIDVFEEYFREMSLSEKSAIIDIFYRRRIANLFFPFDEYALKLFQFFDFEKKKRNYPLYIRTFNKFWNEFVEYPGVLSNEFARLDNLMTCMFYHPLQLLLPEVKIYFISDYSKLFSNFIKEQIKTRFRNKYLIEFVSVLDDADVTVSLIQISNDRSIGNNPHVLISDRLSHNDFMRIENVLRGLSVYKKTLI